MSGTLAVVASDTGRYTLFTVALIQLKHPPGTRIDWGISANITEARNTLVQRALDEDAEWVMFLDDDHVYPHDLLMRLLAHEKPVVSALYLRRQQPFSPVAFSHRNDHGTYQSIDLAELPQGGLLKVHAVGAGGLLVRAEVFNAIEPPWFEHGKVGDWDASEDIIFSEKANTAGFDVYVDLEAQLGHLSPSAVWPSWVDQEWAVGFSVADGLRLFCPIEKAAAAEAEADAVRR